MAFTNAEIMQATMLALMRYGRTEYGVPQVVLYNNGEQYAGLTGGWSTPVLGRTWWESHYIDAIFNADNMELNQTDLVGGSDIYNCGVRTVNTVDTRSYTKIGILAYSETNANKLNNIAISPSTQWDYSAGVDFGLQAGINTIIKPLSAFTGRTGADYIRINLLTDTFDGATYPPYHKTKIYKVWLE